MADDDDAKRRTKIAFLLLTGISQAEIATRLAVQPRVVARDVAALRTATADVTTAESVLVETNISIAAALADGTLDVEIMAGPIAMLREVAARVDAASPRDNVSLPTYLRACDAMHLTPASRAERKKEPTGGKLAQLRAVQGGKSTKRTAQRPGDRPA